jgi:hemerythrin-like domain-containing protein
MKATGLLKNDHKQILRALDVLEQMMARVQRGEIVNQTDALDMAAFLQAYADRHHQGKEESILFPALLRDRDQKNYGQLCCIIFEHNQERCLAQGLEEAIRTKKPKDFVFCASQLVDKLRAHIDKEDRFLFELADSVLSREEDERVVAEMENFEHAWQQQVLTRLLHRLDEMEATYVGGAHAGIATRH